MFLQLSCLSGFCEDALPEHPLKDKKPSVICFTQRWVFKA
jgi:hypothetical protein